jgi:hypothetical protein
MDGVTINPKPFVDSLLSKKVGECYIGWKPFLVWGG